MVRLTPIAPWAGASVAVVYDARNSETTPASSHVLGGANLRMHVLPAGSTFDPKSGTVVAAAAPAPKTALGGLGGAGAAGATPAISGRAVGAPAGTASGGARWSRRSTRPASRTFRRC